MSTLEVGISGLEPAEPARPKLRRLVPHVIGGLVVGAILWGFLTEVLGSLDAMPSVWYPVRVVPAPWTVNSVWSFAAEIGWLAAVAACFGACVHRWLRRGEIATSRFWCLVATAAAFAVISAVPLQSWWGGLAAALLTTAMCSLLAFDPAGQPQSAPAKALDHWAMSAGLLVAGLGLVAAFYAFHPFVNATSPSLFVTSPTAGHTTSAATIQMGQDTYAQLDLGSPPGAVSIRRVQLLGQTNAVRVTQINGVGRDGLIGPLRQRFPAGQAVSLIVHMTLTRCAPDPARITAVRLSYETLGLSSSETVQLPKPLTLSCPWSGNA